MSSPDLFIRSPADSGLEACDLALAVAVNDGAAGSDAVDAAGGDVPVSIAPVSIAPGEADADGSGDAEDVEDADDERARFRVATFGLAPRFHRLLEIICRHARHNPFRFQIGEALAVTPATLDGIEFDIALVDVTTQDGSETARLLKLLPTGQPVIEVGRRLHHARGSDDVHLRNFSADVLSVLNHTAAALTRRGTRGRRLHRLVEGSAAMPADGRPHRAPRVLVVDPSPSIRSQVSVAIRRIGADAEETGTLAAALEILARRRYELVITELDLPDGDGLEVMRAVRRLDESRRAPVVVLSERGGWLDQARAAMAGCSGFLAKPATFATLHATARRTLARRRVATRYLARDVAGAFTVRDGWLVRWSSRGASGTMLPPASSGSMRRPRLTDQEPGR